MSNLRFRTLSISLLLGVAAALSVAAASGGAPPEPLRHLPTPRHLKADTLAALRGRMVRHGNTMSNLVRAVILLDRPTVRILAGRIADEEIVARAGAAAPEPGMPALSPDFYAAQDTLRAAAQALATAALPSSDDRDGDQTLADRFAVVARTCVACHSVYLRPSAPVPQAPSH